MAEEFRQFESSFLKKLQRLKIRTRRNFLGSRQGSHITNRRGQGLEFSEYKPYTPGDDFRHIDWGIYARNDKLYIKQFRSEEDLNVLLLLDNSSSMLHPFAADKFKILKQVSLAIGYITLANSDSLQIFSLAEQNLKSFAGAQNINQLYNYLQSIDVGKKLDLENAMISAITRNKYHGKCFVISDFFYPEEELFSSLDLLRSKNYEVSLLQILSSDELKPDFKNISKIIDVETDEELEVFFNESILADYIKILNRHLDAIKYYAERTGSSYLLINTKEQINEVILQKFFQAGILR